MTTQVRRLFAGILLMVVCAATTCCPKDQVRARTIPERMALRTFPSIFQAWSPIDNLKGEDHMATVARHDLVFNSVEFFRLKWDADYDGLATGFTPESIAEGLALRSSLLKQNPNMILLVEIRYRDAEGGASTKNSPGSSKQYRRGYLPDYHRWWRRDASGKRVMGWEEGGYIQLDFGNPEFRDHVALQCQAAVKSGVVDGVMLDWWGDDDARVAMVKAIRARIGENALILANANDRKTPRTAPYINGYFMECYGSRTAEDWKRIGTTLQWAEQHLKEPRLNCLETWYHKSRNDLNLMRAVTTLSLTTSNGYCLFSDPNDLPVADHLHNWYPFWERKLGTPVAAGQEHPDGSIWREFTSGTVVYNPMGNAAVSVTFSAARISVATGRNATTHSVAGCDGDIFLLPPKVKSKTSEPIAHPRGP